MIEEPRIDIQNGRRVAIVHYWLVGMRGGERVIEALCRMFPGADLFTHVADRAALSDALNRHRIVETRIGRLPMARRFYQKYLPLMPRALEELDLSGYDLVISSESGPAKGVIAPPGAPHLCYCHSPMRYLWDQYHVYRGGAGRLTRALMPRLAHDLRQWDVTSAARVDGFAANSSFVAERIRKYWRRDADIVHPPVAVDDFAPVARGELGDFYLWASELAPYKRPDLAVEAFRRLGKPLVVIGGPDATVRELRRAAGPQTTFLGKVPFAELRARMARCRALIFPAEEDFGIVPVEIMASGRPVIAYGRGGALDTVVDGETGLFFPEQSVEALIDAVERFERSELSSAGPDACVARARGFAEPAFRAGIARALAGIGA
ncbi:GDP-mannose-dependent alpha-(1-6)-phosphatidylinositol monomannoside mannosyltransferase [Roseivivax jejudonensis]|uniref:GDP-mannose-dependent alpha-(1-6)-phosphatidylinositol monomannoside mannosyltransferase n=1 Tax=Roseivivax jejudonensis TaxID=1529041 RepID=A0A1X6ZK36_9RHOB|nr:glycosyltransferase [Roseivivax jejudonensis]SLN53333.1 GDP-mannose-dependent alpha-(1-6)-phosphatidylinositol monomannoside mannosyltransferase [Roseivivax jejudonensis]